MAADAKARQAAAVVAGALAVGLLAMAAGRTSATSFVADAGTLNHAFVRLAEEGMRRRLGLDTRVSEVRLERSKTLHTLRATVRGADGGFLDLQVNRNDRGLEHTGLLRGRDIRVPKDSALGGILQKVEERETPPAQHSAQPRIFTLDGIRAAFSLGQGQLVLHEADFSSRLANVALRGKEDLRAHTISAGGTYLPMSSLPRLGIPTLLTGSHADSLHQVCHPRPLG